MICLTIRFRTFIVILLLGLFSQEYLSAQRHQYIFLGHTYEWHTGGAKVDHRLEELDFSDYSRIWLGGDICSEASLNYSTLQYIDSLFDIGAPGNHWSLGNHDIRNGNVEWFEELTGRETYYAYHSLGVTTMVLNTCLTPYQCEDLEKQFTMIQNVCDTLAASSHLIALMHHAVWDSLPGLPWPGSYSHTEFPFWNASCKFLPNNTFRGQIYPLLVSVKDRGIHVICVSGDMGANAKKFEAESTDGIIFLGCGLNNSYYTDPVIREQQPRDQVLIFAHEPQSRSLSWTFVTLNSLLDD